MFETKTKQSPLINDPTIVPAAVIGYFVLHFPLKPTGKMKIDRVHEIVKENMYPVIAWRLADGKLEPLTIVPPPEAATPYLIMPGGRIFSVSDPAQRWANQDQFFAHLLLTWQSGMPPVEAPQTFAVSPAAVPSLIALPGFF